MAYTARQNLVIRSFLAIASKLGPWAKGHDAEGAFYVDDTINGAKAQGFACRNCAFWKAPNGCAIVKGAIQPQVLCRLHVIPQERIVRSTDALAASPRRRIQGETL